jgi:hypothetical protein
MIILKPEVTEMGRKRRMLRSSGRYLWGGGRGARYAHAPLPFCLISRVPVCQTAGGGGKSVSQEVSVVRQSVTLTI